MNDKTLKTQIREARGKFIAMAATYSLGVFNDQFFKQAAMLLAVARSMDHIQGYAMEIFALPYLLFAASAGWLADRFSKGKIVIFAKILELAAMICGAIGIITLSWPLILTMVFTMGLQSAIFSPALNGSIPELYPASYVTKANAILKVAVTGMILGGVTMAGFALNMEGPAYYGVRFGRWAVAAGVLIIASLGVIGSFGVPRRAAAAPETKFPWTGPLDTIRELMAIRKDSLLTIVVSANVFAWFIGSLQILVINKMGLKQFGLSETNTSLLVASEVVGIAVGGLLAGLLAKGKRWYRVLVPSVFAMAIFTGLIAVVPGLPHSMQFVSLLAILCATGAGGGLLIIPCESFIQVRPAPERKGAVIAACNFAVFAGMMTTGRLSNVLNERVLPTNSFLLMSGLAFTTAILLWWALRKQEANG